MCFKQPKPKDPVVPAFTPPAQMVTTGGKVKGPGDPTVQDGTEENIQAKRRKRKASATLGL